MSPAALNQTDLWLSFAELTGAVAVSDGARHASPLVIRDMIIDPSRVQELINPEFRPDGPFMLAPDTIGEVLYRYDALPAALADAPTAFGCLVVEDQRLGGETALIAITWDVGVIGWQGVSPVVVSADMARFAVVLCGLCDIRAEDPHVATCTAADCPMRERSAA